MNTILTVDSASNETEQEVDPEVARAIADLLELEIEQERQSNPDLVS